MDKRVLIFIAALILSAFLAGRFSAPEKIKIQKETVTVASEVRDEEKSGEKVEVTTQITRPDGTKISRTRLETKHDSKIETSKETLNETKEKKEITNRQGVVVSALIGLPLTDLSKGPVYGASFSKQFIGPIHLGAFMFTDMRVGISLGLEL
jgi:hypothetical protein